MSIPPAMPSHMVADCITPALLHEYESAAAAGRWTRQFSGAARDGRQQRRRRRCAPRVRRSPQRLHRGRGTAPSAPPRAAHLRAQRRSRRPRPGRWRRRRKSRWCQWQTGGSCIGWSHTGASSRLQRVGPRGRGAGGGAVGPARRGPRSRVDTPPPPPPLPPRTQGDQRGRVVGHHAQALGGLHADEGQEEADAGRGGQHDGARDERHQLGAHTQQGDDDEDEALTQGLGGDTGRRQAGGQVGRWGTGTPSGDSCRLARLQATPTSGLSMRVPRPSPHPTLPHAPRRTRRTARHCRPRGRCP